MPWPGLVPGLIERYATNGMSWTHGQVCRLAQEEMRAMGCNGIDGWGTKTPVSAGAPAGARGARGKDGGGGGGLFEDPLAGHRIPVPLL